MYELPVTINIGDVEYPIRNDGDYRVVLNCFSVLQDKELQNNNERLLGSLMVFYDDINSADDALSLNEEEMIDRVMGMYDFFNMGQQEVGAQCNCKVIDWEQDEQLIISAINKVAGKEVRAEEYMHWWTFMGYYMGVGEGAFSTIVSIRYKILKGKKLEKYEQEFRKENPHYFIWNHSTVTEQDADKYIRTLWNNGGRED